MLINFGAFFLFRCHFGCRTVAVLILPATALGKAAQTHMLQAISLCFAIPCAGSWIRRALIHFASLISIKTGTLPVGRPCISPSFGGHNNISQFSGLIPWSESMSSIYIEKVLSSLQQIVDVHFKCVFIIQ